MLGAHAIFIHQICRSCVFSYITATMPTPLVRGDKKKASPGRCVTVTGQPTNKVKTDRPATSVLLTEY